MPCIPPTQPSCSPSWAGQGLGKREFPSPYFLKPTPPQSPSTSMARRRGGRKGWAPTCALCPSQPTLSMSPRQRKKATRTTPTMKGWENPSPPHLMLSSSQDGIPLEGILGKSLNLPLRKESCWSLRGEAGWGGVAFQLCHRLAGEPGRIRLTSRAPGYYLTLAVK